MQMRMQMLRLMATLLVTTACGTAARGKSSTIRPIHALEWAAQAPGMPQRLTTLWGDRTKGASGVLIKLPGGFDSGLHAHSADYHGVLISGTWIHIDADGAGADKELSPGSYVMQPGMGMHIDKCKQGSECILFIYQDAEADIIGPGN